MSGMQGGREEITISSGEYAAVVHSLGAALKSLSLAGRELLDGFDRPEENPVARGQALLPFPNRIEDGEYVFAGERLKLPLDEPDKGHAIHGLTRWSEWRVLDGTEESVKLACDLAPSPGYPFSLALEVEYALSGSGLLVRTTATNTGEGPLPFGAGFHPYFTVGTGSVDEALLRVPAGSRYLLDERLIPKSLVPVEGSDLDFREERAIGGTKINACFTGLAADPDGRSRVTFAHPGGEPEVSVWMDERFRYVQLYTGEDIPDESRRRKSLAIEPMTCAPNAFNTGEGLISLEPGESFAAEWGVAAFV
jgi:aldose 1-epimerase